MEKPETLSQKIVLVVIGTLLASLLGWGVWITTQTFAIDDIQSCVEKNEQSIEKKASYMQNQLNIRMDKQEKYMQKQDEKLDDINKILMEINKSLGRLENK